MYSINAFILDMNMFNSDFSYLVILVVAYIYEQYFHLQDTNV